MSRIAQVGILDALRMRETAAAIDDRLTASLAAWTDPSTYPIASPWSSSDLQRIVFEDIFGSDIPANTRSAAMRIPSVARARNLLVSSICRIPLAAMRDTEELDDQPTWLYRCDDGSSVQQRLAWTVDDLIFYGWSCWWRRNGTDGYPVSVGRLNQDAWSIDADNRVLVDGVPADPAQVILIPGLHEGILSFGREALDDARMLYRNVRSRLINPVPLLDLHQTSGEPLTDTEIDNLLARWAAARAGRNGGVSYTNETLEVNELGGGGEQLMIEARNAAALDLARVVGVAGSRIDATVDKASLNYETTTGRNQEFVDFDTALYMTPITARLSLDDVVPRGQRVVFQLADFIAQAPSVSGPTIQD